MSCGLPQYVDGKTYEPVPLHSASQELRDANFPTAGSRGPYDVLTSKGPKGGCRDSPGPATDKVYCVQSVSPSWVAYRWYKFVDQPGMQQAHLTAAEKEYMQARVEKLHKMMPTAQSKWLKARNAAAEGLSSIDVGAVVTPPEGLEAGYVPIVLYEGVDQPPKCDEFPPPAPLPPPFPPTPSPPSPSPPTPSPPSPTPPTPSPPSPAPSHCGVTKADTGVGGRGSDMQLSKTVGSAADCCAWCESHAQCAMWAWHRESNNQCHLHTSGGVFTKKDGCYSGKLNKKFNDDTVAQPSAVV
jgi:hypothetical protein